MVSLFRDFHFSTEEVNFLECFAIKIKVTLKIQNFTASIEKERRQIEENPTVLHQYHASRLFDEERKQKLERRYMNATLRLASKKIKKQ